MVSSLRVAVVGAGPAGQAHAFAYRNASMTDDLRGTNIHPTVIVDPNHELASTVAARYGFDAASAELDAVVDDRSIDAVSVAVPNHLSAGIIERLIRAGKHVLAEKPLGKNVAEAEHLAQLARDAGVVAAVGFSYRRIPALAKACELVRSGRIGRPYFARVHFYADYALDPATQLTWRFQLDTSGGGALIDMGTHAIDAAEYLLGPVAEVSAATLSTEIAERPMPGLTTAGAPRPTGKVDTDDTASFSLRHSSGPLTSVLVSRVAAGMPCELGIEVFGSAGHVAFDFSRINEIALYQAGGVDSGLDGPRRVIAGPAFPLFGDVMPMAARGNTAGYGEAFIAQAQKFLRCVLDGTQMDTDFTAAVQTLRIAQAVTEADATGHAVPVPSVTGSGPVRPALPLT